MSTRIPYNSDSSNIGREIASYVNSVQETLAKGRRLLAKLNSMTSSADWTALELEVGGMRVGDGQSLWRVIANAQQQIDSSVVAETSRLDKRGE